MKYTKEAIQTARQTNLVHWLQSNSYVVKKRGKDWSLEGHNSLLVRENRWKNFYTGQGGNTLDFLIEIEGMTFSEAMEALNIEGGRGSQVITARNYITEKKGFNIPEKNHNYRRVAAYLTKTRGIDIDTIKTLTKEKLLWQDPRGNCVFPLRNREGKITGAILRGTLSSRRWVGTSPGSVNELGWRWPGKDSSVLVFVEAPIEAMSLKQMRPEFRQYYFVALGGLHLNVFREAVEYIRPSRVVIALNSDEEAKKAAEAFGGWLEEEGYPYDLIIPILKDWNDDLINQKQKGDL